MPRKNGGVTFPRQAAKLAKANRERKGSVGQRWKLWTCDARLATYGEARSDFSTKLPQNKHVAVCPSRVPCLTASRMSQVLFTLLRKALRPFDLNRPGRVAPLPSDPVRASVLRASFDRTSRPHPHTPNAIPSSGRPIGTNSKKSHRC